jgi:hypothetical protein
LIHIIIYIDLWSLLEKEPVENGEDGDTVTLFVGIYIFLYLNICIYIYVENGEDGDTVTLFVGIYVYLYVCMYVYICIYMYVYI